MDTFIPASAYSLRVRHKIRKSPLPLWCINAIRSLAYEQGHSAGQSEIDMLTSSMIYDFEQALANKADHIPRLAPFNVQVKVEDEQKPRSVQVHAEDADDAAVAALVEVGAAAYVTEEHMYVVSVTLADKQEDPEPFDEFTGPPA